jgi:type II secretory pathway predicted ATPase ExeA
MYEAYFGFTDSPFPTGPRTSWYVPNAAMEEARENLVRCVQRAAGPAVAIGPAGIGKTLLSLLIVEQLQENMDVVRLECGRVSSRRALLQSILHGLRFPFRGMGEGELRLSLIDHLGGPQTSAEGVLLVVDEAHTLPLRVLEEVRLLSNLIVEGKPKIRVILLGCPLLEERLAAGRMELFSQRLSARCYLTALGRDATREYVGGRIQRSGGTPTDCITDAALKAVYDATEGIPRLINQLCDHAFLLAYAGDHRIVEEWGIREAWADLQRLPVPSDFRGSAQEGERRLGIVEFGELDDDSAAPEFARYDAEPSPGIRLNPYESSAETLDDPGDDFVPAATIGPRTELVFDDFRDPFGESFDREEVIVDRCARLQARLAQELSPWSEPALSRNMEAHREDFADRDRKEGWDDCDGPSASKPVVGRYSTAGPAADASIHQSDLIIALNENGTAEEQASARPITGAQRAEYRDLFARLRHG